MINILLSEDNVDLCKLIANELQYKGYKVFTAHTGNQAIDIYENNPIDMLITDIMMPETNGLEVVQYVRRSNTDIPILIITAKTSQNDKYIGFKAGTDDYMTKPIDIDELMLRVEALLRRAKIIAERKITIGGAELNSETYTVTIDDNPIVLPQKEFQILFKLLSYPDQIFTRLQLMNEFWGINSDSDEMTVYTHIHRLRDKFNNCPYFEIVTLRNLGYKAVIK